VPGEDGRRHATTYMLQRIGSDDIGDASRRSTTHRHDLKHPRHHVHRRPRPDRPVERPRQLLLRSCAQKVCAARPSRNRPTRR
jgi:hypothetical protein